jgi:hypothetical protein
MGCSSPCNFNKKNVEIEKSHRFYKRHSSNNSITFSNYKKNHTDINNDYIYSP